MKTVESEVLIERPKAQVWKVLSDLTSTAQYMPGLSELHLTSENKSGAGASRHCKFADGVELHEQVVQWDEGNGYTLKTTEFVKVPMKSNEIYFQLRADGNRTVVQQSMQYQMKGGLIAPLMEIMAKGMMKKTIDKALDGLKTYVEAQS